MDQASPFEAAFRRISEAADIVGVAELARRAKVPQRSAYDLTGREVPTKAFVNAERLYEAAVEVLADETLS